MEFCIFKNITKVRHIQNHTRHSDILFTFLVSSIDIFSHIESHEITSNIQHTAKLTIWTEM